MAVENATDYATFISMTWVTEQRCPRCLKSVTSFASIMLSGNEPWLGRVALDPVKTLYECPSCRVVWSLNFREEMKGQLPHYEGIHMRGPDRLERPPGIKLFAFRKKRIRTGPAKYRGSKR
jgi:hypothetical protein